MTRQEVEKLGEAVLRLKRELRSEMELLGPILRLGIFSNIKYEESAKEAMKVVMTMAKSKRVLDHKVDALMRSKLQKSKVDPLSRSLLNLLKLQERHLGELVAAIRQIKSAVKKTGGRVPEYR